MPMQEFRTACQAVYDEETMHEVYISGLRPPLSFSTAGYDGSLASSLTLSAPRHKPASPNPRGNELRCKPAGQRAFQGLYPHMDATGTLAGATADT